MNNIVLCGGVLNTPGLGETIKNDLEPNVEIHLKDFDEKVKISKLI